MSKQMLELAERLALMPAIEAVRDPQDWAVIMEALRRCSADSDEAGTACKNCRHRGSHLAWRCDACGFEVKRPLPTEPQSATVNVEETPQDVAEQAAYFDAHAERFAAAHAGMAEIVEAMRAEPQCQAESAPGREALWHTIAKHIACKKDCQARPSGCGCARDAANTIIRAMTAQSRTGEA